MATKIIILLLVVTVIILFYKKLKLSATLDEARYLLTESSSQIPVECFSKSRHDRRFFKIAAVSTDKTLLQYLGSNPKMSHDQVLEVWFRHSAFPKSKRPTLGATFEVIFDDGYDEFILREVK